ncbi:uncharacterized protein F5Z01DRAFT_637418 [Emericellopsis atlantica]|uniref:Uncharacterized protein n=1 Tax=Emericellopsis atlantica TaxID=2614577 RepID=A0A9P8CP25_9HYPO|nr:uncharacterized protein F5Z01DRAFT_637418 [Emericellopsis atlantica]KAG9253680.1 hypothetical protein F5Z01DRAFT_637418 [Emericellopsis atlantica]
MRLSTLSLGASLSSAAVAASAVDDYLAIFEHATITSPAGGIVDFSGPFNITWSTPSNASSPTDSRFRDLTKGASFWFSYNYENITGYDPSLPSDNTTNILIDEVADFDPSNNFYEWEDPADAVKSTRESLEEKARFMKLSDLPGGARWSVTISFSVDNGTAEEEGAEYFVKRDSSMFDIEGVDGYEPDQEGIEWGSAAVALRPVGMLAGAAVAAAAMLLL